MLLLLLNSVMSNFVAPCTVTRQVRLSMEFSRQEYWSALPCPPPGALPDPGIEPRSPALQTDSFPCEPSGKPHLYICVIGSIFNYISSTLTYFYENVKQ